MSNRSRQVDGSKISALRVRDAWTQEEFAKRVGCAKRTIENAEAGRPLLMETIGRIAEVFHVEPATLLLSADPIPATPGASRATDLIAPAARIQRLLSLIRHHSRGIATRAARKFLSLSFVDSDSLITGLTALLACPLPGPPKLDVVEPESVPINPFVIPCTLTKRYRGYNSQQQLYILLLKNRASRFWLRKSSPAARTSLRLGWISGRAQMLCS